MIELGRMYIIVYALIQDLFPLKLTTKTKYVLLATKVSTVLLAIIILSTILLLILPFALFRMCLGITLKILHGKLYGGFLGGLDTLFEVNSDKTTLNVIVIYSSNDKMSTVIERLKSCVSEIHNCSFKFSSKIKNVFGYRFYVKNQVELEDVFDIMVYNHDEYMSREMLFDYLKKNCTDIKNDQMWSATIFSQPILWNKSRYKNGIKQYAAVFAVRHSLADGPSLATAFQKYALKNISQSLDVKVNEKIRKESIDLNLDNVYIRRNPITTKLDGSSLKIEDNSNYHIAWFFEEKPRYISTIKKIKEKTKANFTEIISAAICASINDYVKQRQVKLTNFTIGTVFRLNRDDLLKLKNGYYKFDEINNHFGLVALSLPFNLEERSMKNIIDYLHLYTESLRCAVDPIVAYVFLRNICTYIPITFVRLLCKSFMSNMTIGVTNMIGFQKSTFCETMVDDMFFFTREFLDTGFMFHIFSYDDRLQLIVTSRKGFVYTRDDLQEILNNTFKYIEKAEYEILKGAL